LRVRPYSTLLHSTQNATSGRLVRPSTIAPAARRRATVVASRGARWARRGHEPIVDGMPSTAIISLTVHGTPCSGPRQSPRRASRSAARASARAASNRSTTTALSAGFTSAMRARCASTTSTGDRAAARILPASSNAPSDSTAPMRGVFPVPVPVKEM
jgi:hypothetical protein